MMKNVLKWVCTITAAAVMSVSAAHAQNIDLGAGGADLIWRGDTGQRAGQWMDLGPLSPGDNRRDLVIGAPGTAGVTGAVYVVFGGPVLTGERALSTANVVINGGAAGDGFGTATAVGPITVNSSNLTSNLVVGAPSAMGGKGVVYVFPTPLDAGVYSTANAVFTIVGAAGDQLGTAIATADINNDGYREIVIGAPGNNRIYIIAGAPTLSGTRDLAITGGDLLINGTGIGRVIQAGDVTGDGTFEILVGAPTQNAVYLLTGTYPEISTLPANADAVFTGIDAGDEAGASLRIADIDEDGLREIIIGAPGGDGPSNGRNAAGEAYVFWGRSAFGSTSLTFAAVTFYGATAGQRFAEAMTSGDINRDIPNDLVFLVPNASAAGELYVFYGRARTGFGTDLGDGRRLVDLAVTGASRRIIGNPASGPIATAQVFEVTGEGARDIIVGVPSDTSNKGAVLFTISPKMTAAPDAIALELVRGQSSGRAVVLTNVSTIPISWSASANQAWLSPSPATGSSVAGDPGSLTLHINSSGLAVGVHTGTLTFTSTSQHLQMTEVVNVTLTVTAPPTTPTLRRSDFNGDGQMDILWQNISDGYLATWSLNGTNLLSSDLLSPNRMPDNNWRMAATGDFNNDNKPDIVWHERTQGWIGIWLMNGLTLMSSTSLSPASRERVADINWKVVGAVDLNNDGHDDILWQEQTMGYVAVWLLNGTTVTASIGLNPERVGDTNWKIVGNGDFNADGKNDLIWQNMATGYLAAWFMNGVNLVDSVLLSPQYVTDTTWKIVAVGDVDVDGKPDLVWQDQAAGWLAIWLMNGTTLKQSIGFNPERVSDTNWKIAGPK